MEREQIDRTVRWILDTCRLFGCRESLGLMVAHLFVQGLEREGVIKLPSSKPD